MLGGAATDTSQVEIGIAQPSAAKNLWKGRGLKAPQASARAGLSRGRLADHHLLQPY